MNVAEAARNERYDRTVDEIGPWSEVKLEIVQRYATEYSAILSNQRNPAFKHDYIDAFAGSGLHLSKASGEFVPGSPLNALLIQPPFQEYHFVELDEAKAGALEEIAGERNDVKVYRGDCNQILPQELFPRVRFEDYRRALCLLDPYGLHLSWEVIASAGRSRSIEVFLNFPVQDINRNVLRRNPDDVDPVQAARLDFFWGDDSWREVAWKRGASLWEEAREKVCNEELAELFRQRLINVAGFKDVPRPCPMRNEKRAVVYYLYFASHRPVAAGIVKHIFEKFGRT